MSEGSASCGCFATAWFCVVVAYLAVDKHYLYEHDGQDVWIYALSVFFFYQIWVPISLICAASGDPIVTIAFTSIPSAIMSSFGIKVLLVEHYDLHLVPTWILAMIQLALSFLLTIPVLLLIIYSIFMMIYFVFQSVGSFCASQENQSNVLEHIANVHTDSIKKVRRSISFLNAANNEAGNETLKNENADKYVPIDAGSIDLELGKATEPEVELAVESAFQPALERAVQPATESAVESASVNTFQENGQNLEQDA